MIYRKGDATETDAPYLLHGCNCRGAMGSGIARTIRDKFPAAYDEYKRTEETVGLVLGRYCVSRESTPRIVNLFTQQNAGSDGKVYADLIAIRSAVRTFISDEFPDIGRQTGKIYLAMPKIGCGLGGLNWINVERTFKQIEIDFGHLVEFIVYEI